MNITTIGLDIAKNVFHCVCANKENHQVKKKMLKRAQALPYFHTHQICRSMAENKLKRRTLFIEGVTFRRFFDKKAPSSGIKDIVHKVISQFN